MITNVLDCRGDHSAIDPIDAMVVSYALVGDRCGVALARPSIREGIVREDITVASALAWAEALPRGVVLILFDGWWSVASASRWMACVWNASRTCSRYWAKRSSRPAKLTDGVASAERVGGARYYGSVHSHTALVPYGGASHFKAASERWFS